MLALTLKTHHGQFLCLQFLPPEINTFCYLKNIPATTSYPIYRQRTWEVTELFDGLKSGNVLRVRADEVLCQINIPGRCCAITPAGELLYGDDDHLNKDWAKLLAPLILEAM